jgi:hypothetical protein
MTAQHPENRPDCCASAEKRLRNIGFFPPPPLKPTAPPRAMTFAGVSVDTEREYWTERIGSNELSTYSQYRAAVQS